MLLISACGGGTPPMSPAPPPTPSGDPPTANVYVLPGAVALGANAFGDEAIVIYKGERMRWRNLDSVEHTLVPDTPSLPEFDTTGTLAPGDERSFLMMTQGPRESIARNIHKWSARWWCANADDIGHHEGAAAALAEACDEGGCARSTGVSSTQPARLILFLFRWRC